jgi:hypothetical protein
VSFALRVVACAVLLAFPAAAHAAQRYAAPGATGVECTKPEPCNLADSINGASANDEVIVTAGEYTVTGAPINVVYGGLQIHGDPAGPMPRVGAELGGLPAINMNAEGSSLSYIEVVNRQTEGIGVRCGSSSRVERVRATGVGEGAAGLVQFQECLVRDSLLQGEGTNSLGMESLAVSQGEPPSTVSGVTAIASGADSAGIQSRYNDSVAGSHILNLSNSIAQGASDLRTEDANGPGRIAVSNSNFDLIKEETPGAIGGAGNQTAPPLFVNAGGGDYREASGSPTIDAGSPTGIGPLDLAGNPRALGPAPDIGAFEFVPPPVAGALTSLTLSPKAFRPLGGGGAVASRRGAKKNVRGTRVHYALTAAANVDFTVERALRGRRVGGECRKRTSANRNRKRCTRYRALKSDFALQGVSGDNGFRFSGRIGTKALTPGRYRLVAVAGASVKRASFTVTR